MATSSFPNICPSNLAAKATAKAALKFGSEAWVLKKREEKRLEAAQMKFLRHLQGITKLDKEKNQCTRVGTLIVATIYLQLIQSRYMFRSFIVLQCSHQHCV